MSTSSVFKTVSMTLAAAAVCFGLRAHATTIDTFMNFSAPSQSLWGPDGPAMIKYSGSASWKLPVVGTEETFGYGFTANAGTVSGIATGSLATSYTPVLSAPGVANIGLQYNPVTGSLLSVIDASATLTFFGQTFGPDVGLVVVSNFAAGAYGVPQVGVGAYDIANPSIDLGAVSADLDFAVVQNNYFTPTGIDGTLFYQREGSSVVRSQSFDLATASTLPVSLDQAGTYDFWFGKNWDLANQFSSTAILGLTASASTLIGCGKAGLEGCEWDTTLADPTIYSSDPFEVNFNGWAQPTKFQIEVAQVQVPVPHSLGLATLGGGILLVGVLDALRRRRVPEGKTVL
jgi:hypothetical protein